MVLDFGRFDESAESARTAVGGGAFQVGVAAFDVGAEELGGPVGLFEEFDGGVDLVGRIDIKKNKLFDLENLTIEPDFKDQIICRPAG
jgi:hypothetical protein